MPLRYWLSLMSAIALGVWAGQQLSWWTQEWLSCFPLERLWK